MHQIATPADVLPEAPDRKRSRLRVLNAALAAVGLVFMAMTLGERFMGGAILGGLIVFAIVINPFLGIVTLLGTTMLDLPTFLVGSGRLTANNFLGLILLVLFITQLCMTRDLWFLRTPQVIIALAIGAVFAASLIHSSYVYIPSGPLRRDYTENTLFPLFSRTAFLLMFLNFVRTRTQMLLVLLALLVFTLTVMPSVFYNLLTWQPEIDPLTGKVAEFRVSSDTSSWGKNENRLAFMCNISILLIWMFAQISKMKVVRTLAAPVILILAGVILATGSRSGFISLGMVLLFLLFQKGVSPMFRLSVVGAGLVCLLMLLVILPPKASQRLLNLSPDQSERVEGWRSTKSRIETNEHALEILMNDPLLGVGPGNFRWVHRELYPYTLSSGRPNHNSYLWAATEGGIPALLLYLLLFFFTWRDLQVSQRSYSQDHELWHVARFLKGYLMVFLFFSAFADFWLTPQLYLPVGLAVLIRRLAAEDEGSRPVPVAAAHPSPA
jgi:O-Antigen ligase